MDCKIVKPGKEYEELSKYIHFLIEEWNIFFSLTSESVKQQH